jgi:hypothetical protein
MRRKRKRRRHDARRRPELTIAQILAWADFYHERTGQWPRLNSRIVYNAVGEKWIAIDRALRKGFRGLPEKSSLAQLLAEQRGVRHKGRLPKLIKKKILAWADGHYRRHKRWPTLNSGPIADAPGETWSAVESALRNGGRGFPAGSSLARFLEHHRGVRNPAHLPRLTYGKILAWADAFKKRKGKWPTGRSGPIEQAAGENWMSINIDLHKGLRGLPGAMTVARLLEKYRHVRHRDDKPRLTYKQILTWADAHHRRTGSWPNPRSGDIVDAPGETWMGVQSALIAGMRGLPRGFTLPQLLAKQRGVRNIMRLPKFTHIQILTWADHFHRMTGSWPRVHSGRIPGVPGETWTNVENALRLGLRGLPEGSSLFRFLQEHGRIPEERGSRPRR